MLAWFWAAVLTDLPEQSTSFCASASDAIALPEPGIMQPHAFGIDQRTVQVPGVIEVSAKDLQGFVAAVCTRKAARVPGLAIAAGASLLGRGSYAAVYRASLAALGVAGASGEEVALKVAAPAAPWEFAVVRALVSRVRIRYAPLFMPTRCIVMSAAAGEEAEARPRRAALARKQTSENGCASMSVLAMPLGRHGTLLDLVNSHKSAGREIGATLVLYLSLQLVLVRPPLS